MVVMKKQEVERRWMGRIKKVKRKIMSQSLWFLSQRGERREPKGEPKFLSCILQN